MIYKYLRHPHVILDDALPTLPHPSGAMAPHENGVMANPQELDTGYAFKTLDPGSFDLQSLFHQKACDDVTVKSRFPLSSTMPGPKESSSAGWVV